MRSCKRRHRIHLHRVTQHRRGVGYQKRPVLGLHLRQCASQRPTVSGRRSHRRMLEKTLLIWNPQCGRCAPVHGARSAGRRRLQPRRFSAFTVRAKDALHASGKLSEIRRSSRRCRGCSAPPSSAASPRRRRASTQTLCLHADTATLRSHRDSTQPPRLYADAATLRRRCASTQTLCLHADAVPPRRRRDSTQTLCLHTVAAYTAVSFSHDVVLGHRCCPIPPDARHTHAST